jgi:hypothetical protein
VGTFGRVVTARTLCAIFARAIKVIDKMGNVGVYFQCRKVKKFSINIVKSKEEISYDDQ